MTFVADSRLRGEERDRARERESKGAKTQRVSEKDGYVSVCRTADPRRSNRIRTTLITSGVGARSGLIDEDCTNSQQPLWA